VMLKFPTLQLHGFIKKAKHQVLITYRRQPLTTTSAGTSWQAHQQVRHVLECAAVLQENWIRPSLRQNIVVAASEVSNLGRDCALHPVSSLHRHRLVRTSPTSQGDARSRRWTAEDGKASYQAERHTTSTIMSWRTNAGVASAPATYQHPHQVASGCSKWKKTRRYRRM